MPVGKVDAGLTSPALNRDLVATLITSEVDTPGELQHLLYVSGDPSLKNIMTGFELDSQS